MKNSIIRLKDEPIISGSNFGGPCYILNHILVLPIDYKFMIRKVNKKLDILFDEEFKNRYKGLEPMVSAPKFLFLVY